MNLFHILFVIKTYKLKKSIAGEKEVKFIFYLIRRQYLHIRRCSDIFGSQCVPVSILKL